MSHLGGIILVHNNNIMLMCRNRNKNPLCYYNSRYNIRFNFTYSVAQKRKSIENENTLLL